MPYFVLVISINVIFVIFELTYCMYIDKFHYGSYVFIFNFMKA